MSARYTFIRYIQDVDNLHISPNVISYLDGDITAAALMAYFIKIAEADHKKSSDGFFVCLAKETRYVLSLKEDKERAAVNRLERAKLIEISHRENNGRWIRVNVEKLAEIMEW